MQARGVTVGKLGAALQIIRRQLNLIEENILKVF